MTIKNRGGVFGRNPTFNDVDVDGTLSVGGAAIPAPANTAKLDTAQTFTATQTMASGTGGILTLKTTDATGASGDTLGKIDFFAGDTSGGSTGVQASVRGVYDSNGDSSALVFVTGFSTGSGSPTLNERMRVRSGGGITFNGDTAAANALDDYEEGTWTPVLVGSSSAGTATFVSGPNGTYTKIGNQVTVYFSWDISAHTGTGALRVNGLPFTASSATAIGSIMDGNYTYPASRTKLVPYAVGAVIRFYGVGSGVGYTENTLDVVHQMNGTMTYTV